MNLPNFLNAVDNAVLAMSKEELAAFVHEYARTLPENQRFAFLEALTLKKTGKDIKTERDDFFASEIQDTLDALEAIDEEGKCLDSSYNPMWDDWRDDDTEEFDFHDPEKILPTIQKAISLIHKCIDREYYDEGSDLADLLSVVQIDVNGDWQDADGEPFDMNSLFAYELLNGSMKPLVEESLFLFYMSAKPERRAEEMWGVMENFRFYSIKLENIMQLGSGDLPGFDAFLLSWIDCLGTKTGHAVQSLLEEALTMVGDKDRTLEIARRFVVEHPELYRKLLEEHLSNEDPARFFAIGQEALEKIPPSLLVRSEIALLTASYACRMGNASATEKCWLEAFRSDTSVENYLRLRLETKEWEDYRGFVRQIYQEKRNLLIQSGYGKPPYYSSGPNKEGLLGHKEYCGILFFDGEFEEVIRVGLSEKEALGWSYTFMKEGLALFLLLLYKGQGVENPKGIQDMLSRAMTGCAFHAASYCRGMRTQDTLANGTESFFECLFLSWKTKQNITAEQIDKWLPWLEGQLARRTDAILYKGHRNYYDECAAYLSAFGEVLESRGNKGAKLWILGKYKAKYPRHRAFHGELRKYGMK